MKHILIDVIEKQLECTHCGTTYKTAFKKPIELYTQLINAFTRDHKDCLKEKKHDKG